MNLDITYLDYQIDVFFNWRPGVKYKIIPKGRRAGITRGAAHAIIELLCTGNGPILWGETTHGNIERYFERYFLPVLKSNEIPHRFDKQQKILTINGQYCDFRSADNPENWEGFGYMFIFLNEAGIILKNRSLYINSVLPMLIDFPNTKLIAAGVPKGKMLKDGTEHPFYTLHKRCIEGNSQYEGMCINSYQNPLLSKQDIDELAEEIAIFSPDQVNQEIYGQFLEADALNPFAIHWNTLFHTCERLPFDPKKQLLIKVDFNLNPFAITFGHMWRDSKYHYHTIDEGEIDNGSVPAMINYVIEKYEKQLCSCILTGDSTGNKRDIGQWDHASSYTQLKRGWRLKDGQLKLPHNPTHVNSRDDVNYVLFHSAKENPDIDFKVYKNCVNVIRDFKTVQCDAFGEIIKKDRKDMTQKADYLDCERAGINTHLTSWIKVHQKSNSRKR